MVLELLCDRGEVGRRDRRIHTVSTVPRDARNRAVGQALKPAHRLVDADLPRLRLSERDFLDGVLQINAGGFKLLEQIASMHQFKRGRAIAGEPGLQQSTDRLSRVRCIKVRRFGADRLVALCRAPFRLGRLSQAFRKDGVTCELSSIFVERLSADANRGRLFLIQETFREIHGCLSVLGGELKSPIVVGRATNEDFKMYRSV